MEKWPKWLKYTIVWAFYAAAFIALICGSTKILGVPFAVAGYGLQRAFGIKIG